MEVWIQPVVLYGVTYACSVKITAVADDDAPSMQSTGIQSWNNG